MSDNCITCKFSDICKQSEEKRKNCKANVSEDGSIFGYTPDQIAQMQGIEKLK